MNAAEKIRGVVEVLRDSRSVKGKEDVEYQIRKLVEVADYLDRSTAVAFVAFDTRHVDADEVRDSINTSPANFYGEFSVYDSLDEIEGDDAAMEIFISTGRMFEKTGWQVAEDE